MLPPPINIKNRRWRRQLKTDSRRLLQRQFGILAFWYPGIRAFWQSGNIYPLDSSQNRWATETENGKLNTAAGKLNWTGLGKTGGEIGVWRCQLLDGGHTTYRHVPPGGVPPKTPKTVGSAAFAGGWLTRMRY